STAEGSTFDGSTSAAVAAWRRDLGLPPGNTVELGLVYFVPTLPARVVLGEGVQVGSTIQPGGPLFATVNPEPTFTVTLEPSQRNLVPLDAEAIVTHPEVTWTGKVAGAVESADGLSLTVTGPDGGPLCG